MFNWFSKSVVQYQLQYRNLLVHVTKMGKIVKARPQKSRRHKKIKDAERYADDNKNYAPKIVEDKRRNEPPKNIDDQEIPRSVKELMKFKENPDMFKRNKNKNKRLKQKKDNPSYDGLMSIRDKGMTVPLKPVPNFTRYKNETDKSFFWRVERQTAEVLQRSDMERKYKIDFSKAVSKDGNLDKTKFSKKKRKTVARLKARKEEKKEKEKMRKMDQQQPTGFEHLTDEFEFGETVMQPPSLSAPRHAESEQYRKPGKKALLLKDILTKIESGSSGTPNTARQPGQTVKKRDQSLAQQRIQEEERTKVVELYREMRAKKMAAS